MQAYGKGFAHVYNTLWGSYARQIAPSICDFYAATPIGRKNTSVLDLCCGSGHLAVHLLENGYHVVGIDLSEHMLHYAKKNAERFLESGQARFIKADAADFAVDERFGLVLSTYDSLNHLEDEQALLNSFRCVHAVCDGYFIFDLNTRRGLNRWNSIHVNDNPGDSLIIVRGIYDGQGDKAWTRITGFIARSDGKYERFDEAAFNTVFDLERVKAALLDVGWRDVYFARMQNLSTPIQNPEEEGRVFVVAGK